MIRTATILLLLGSAILSASQFTGQTEAALWLPETTLKVDNPTAKIDSSFISGGMSPSVHSASATVQANGDIQVVWYGGEREGSRDTAIYHRSLRHTDQQWSNVRPIMTREIVIRDTQRYIRKLGNPVIVAKGDELWLFFVSVSVGGWSGSAINLSISKDSGQSWGKVQRLISSPFLNVSSLVRTSALLTTNNGILLPSYHEFLGKFSELLHVDKHGKIGNKTRLSYGRKAIQPSVLALDSKRAVAFMRNSTRSENSRIWASRNEDGLSSWQPLQTLPMPNPDSAISALQLDSTDEWLMAFNNHEQNLHDLHLAYRADSDAQWITIHNFEEQLNGKGKRRLVSYPQLLKGRDGAYHLFYTWDRKHIKHVQFSRAALQDMINKAQNSP